MNFDMPPSMKTPTSKPNSYKAPACLTNINGVWTKVGCKSVVGEDASGKPFSTCKCTSLGPSTVVAEEF